MVVTTAGDAPRVLRRSPGRVRLHLPTWPGVAPDQVEAQLGAIAGVRRVRASRATGNVLVEFDEERVELATLVAGAQLAAKRSASAVDSDGATPGRRSNQPAVLQERAGLLGRARIAVPGLDRDPDLARRVVDSIGRSSGVRRVSASRLTGRVLIEFDRHQIEIEDLIAQVAGMDLPDLPPEDCPAHPLDPVPLIQSGTRAAGALIGLTVIAVRRASGVPSAPVSSQAPMAVAATVGILEGLPPLRRALRQGLGRDRAELLVGAVNVVALGFAGSPLGLAVSAAAALRVFTEAWARREAWKAYEERIAGAAEAAPGMTVPLRAGDRAPMAARVIEGSGTMIARDGMPRPLGPGDFVTGGARVNGGPFVVELQADKPFEPQPRPAPPPPTHLDRYLALLGPASLGYAALTAVLTRSVSRTLTALLLVNARPALIGSDAADYSAAARVLRGGVTLVGSRYGRSVRMPTVVFIDGPRVLTDRRLDLFQAVSLRSDLDSSDVLAMAAGVAAASGSPWGAAFPAAARASAYDGRFGDATAYARVRQGVLRLGPLEDADALPEARRQPAAGSYVLMLSRVDGGERTDLGLVALRPRLEAGALRALQACRERGVGVELLSDIESPGARALAERVGLKLAHGDAVSLIRARQSEGEIVALVSDSSHAAPAFAAADLAIALTSGRSGTFSARADMLAPDLDAVAMIVQAGALSRAATDDAIALSVLSNVAGAVWGLRGAPGIERGSHATYISALASIGLVIARLSGGRPSRAATSRLADPDPERWGRPSLSEVFRQLDTSAGGLELEKAQSRAVQRPAVKTESPITAALADQLRSPLNGALALGAGVSLMFGAVADVGLIAAVIIGNAAVGVWQEHQADRAAALLAHEGAASVIALRDGQPTEVQAPDLVVGDVIRLSSGDRVPADARLIESESLEVDEAALTGESLPVSKSWDDPDEASRVVLEGSDVTVGSATAVVFAVGAGTRVGATAAALTAVQPARGTLDARLNRLVKQSLPVVLGGGALVALSGILWRRPIGAQLALGASIATAAVPEGLPLLAGVAEAAVARRLAGRNALVRRLASVEALGRVDVACTDKTGTLTAGQLELTAVEAFGSKPPSEQERREVLLGAALASPHPDAPDVAAHPTDIAVLEGARRAGLEIEIAAAREHEVPFEPARAYHASVIGHRLLVKGAAEAVAPRCGSVRRAGGITNLGGDGARELLQRAEALSSTGLRVLMVAEGDPARVDDPQDLVAVGLIGISDPLRAGVPAAVARCHEAGVRVVMLTGDHPATARAVARQAGLDLGALSLLTGAEMAALDDPELDRRLEQATVIARITPLDKLRIVERLQARDHSVAMTGDGVNDAPALRLADVGVAMGLHGTEVARQAADVVLADDDFASLVETLVEGRSFWLNLRRSLGLLLGGNLGELGMMIGASILGLAAPLTTRQILAVNLVTDILPAVAVAAQQPEHRDLTALRREGGGAGDRALRDDIRRRGWATAAPALAAYVVASRLTSPAQARTVAFGAIVSNQLGQTLSLGRSEGMLTQPVVGAIAASGGFALAAMAVPPLAPFLGLSPPTIVGAALIVAAAVASVRLAGDSLGVLPRPRSQKLLAAGEA